MTVFRKHLWDNRRAFLGWAVVLVAVTGMYASFWPSLGGNQDMSKAMEALPPSIKDAFHMQDIASATGYFGSSVFGILVPFLVAVFAIAMGVKAIATDEEAGTLDLVLAHPVTRVTLAVARYAAIAVALAVASGAILLAMLALRSPAEFTQLSTANLAAICIQLALFGFCFASIAFGIGAFTGRRMAALGGAAAIAVIAYLADSFLPQISGLKWIEKFSPFDWYLGGEPLKNGIQWADSALLLGVGLTFAAAGIWRFHRRDIAV